MTDIKPIQTAYNGYLFRSRLEARWAVFFDEMGIRYEYEPEGFMMNGHDKYLPDFYLPASKIYVEVKPSGAFKYSCGHLENGRENSEKYNLFSSFLDKCGYLIVQGDPYDAMLVEKDIHKRNDDSLAVIFYKTMHVYRHLGSDYQFIKSIDNITCKPIYKFVNKKPFVLQDFYDEVEIPSTNMITIGLFTGSTLFGIDCNTSDLSEGKKLTDYCATIARQARFEHGEGGVLHG